MVMPKIHLSVNDETSEALKELSEKQNKPISALLREAIAEFLESRGIAVDTRVQWGGPRKVNNEDS